MDFRQRIKDITEIVHLFRREQERIILRSQDESELKTSLKTTIPDLNDIVTDNSSIASVLNMECMIMPISKATMSFQKLWPQALVANRLKNCAEVGLIESYGSLWKILPFQDTNPSSKIIIQTSEIGEIPRFLGVDLQIVEQKVEAAVWSVKILNDFKVTTESSFLRNPFPSKSDYNPSTIDDSLGVDSNKGFTSIIVIMELIGKAKDVSDTIIGHKNNNDVNIANNNDPNTVINNTSASRMQMNGSKNDADPSLNAVQRQILVCETSKELRNYSELYVEPVHIGYDGQPIAVLEGVEDNDRNHNYHHRGQDNDLGSGISSVVSNTKELEGQHHHSPTTHYHNPSSAYRSWAWEIMPEAWINSELDFLQDFVR